MLWALFSSFVFFGGWQYWISNFPFHLDLCNYSFTDPSKAVVLNGSDFATQGHLAMSGDIWVVTTGREGEASGM